MKKNIALQPIDDVSMREIHRRVWTSRARRRTLRETANWRKCLVNVYRPMAAPSGWELVRIFLTEGDSWKTCRKAVVFGAAFALGILLTPIGLMGDRVLVALATLVAAATILALSWREFKKEQETAWRRLEASRVNYCRENALGVVLECQFYGVRPPREAAIEAGMPMEPMAPLPVKVGTTAA